MPEPAVASAIAAAGAPLLFLDRLADPGNAGTILRTAEWFGAAGVLFGEGSVDPYNPKVVRATMGAIFRLPIALGVSIAELRSLDLPLYALDAGGEEPLGRHPLPMHALYAVGSEAHGVDDELLPHARILRIGGGGAAESLNAAIAASILLYEIFRGSST
jgi:TrmH family RNA methyltransferase